MEKPPIVYDDFARVDMRVGRIVAVRLFERARNPSYKVEVDFGPLGRKWSSAQITSYPPGELWADWSSASSTCRRATSPALSPRC